MSKHALEQLSKYTYELYPAFVTAYESIIIIKNVEHEVSFRTLTPVSLTFFFNKWLPVVRTFFPIVTEAVTDETKVAFLHATYHYIKHLTNAHMSHYELQSFEWYMLRLENNVNYVSDMPNLREVLTEMKTVLSLTSSSEHTLEARRKNLLEQVDSYLWRFEIEDVD